MTPMVGMNGERMISMTRFAEIPKINYNKADRYAEQTYESVLISSFTKEQHPFRTVIFVAVNSDRYIVIGEPNLSARTAGITGLSGTQNAVWYKVGLEESNEIRRFVENSKTMSWNGYTFFRFPAKFNEYL